MWLASVPRIQNKHDLHCFVELFTKQIVGVYHLEKVLESKGINLFCDYSRASQVFDKRNP